MPQRHRPELSESVSGEPMVTYRRTPRTFASGRTCAVAGCPTVLSIYNSGKRCAAHDQITCHPAASAPPASAPDAAPRRVRPRRRVVVEDPPTSGRRAS